MVKRRRLSLVLIAACAVMLAGCSGAAGKGIAQLEKKEYKQAAATFAEVIKSGKDLAEAYHGQGIAYWELKEYEKARTAMKKALENQADETATIYQIIGDSSMALGDYEEALTSYWKAMSSEGLTEKQLKEISYNEVIAYEKLKDWNSAKLKISAYMMKYPDDAEAAKEAEFLETR